MSDANAPQPGAPESALPVEAGGQSGAPRSGIERLTSQIAIFGGLLTLAVALVATTSVFGRWLFKTPIEGDFEYVKMVTAIAVFAYLPYTQARRGNIIVDTFTGWLPAGVNRALDAFWDLVYAAFMGFAGYCLVYGTLSAYTSRETTMQKQILIWPSIALSTALCIILALVAVVTAVKLFSRKASRGPS